MTPDTTFRSARVASVRDVTPTVRLFEIVPDGGDPPVWEPGAHLTVEIPVGDRTETRSYSLVWEPDGRAWRIAVKRAGRSRGGSAHLWTLAPGDPIRIAPPRSIFRVDDARGPVLLLAGGIGITPMTGIAAALVRRGADVRLVHAARTRDELAFAAEFAALLGPRYGTVVSAEGRRADPAALFATLPADGVAAVCGPMPLLDDARRAWREAGRHPAQLRFETFGSSGHRPAAPFTVRIPGFGRDITVPETRTLLDALEDAGIEVISDCRRGECGLCVLDVVAVDGAIDHRDVFFSDAEREEGRRICACVSRAIGTLTIDPLWRPDGASHGPA